MTSLRHLTLDHPDFPARLRILPAPPRFLSLVGSIEASSTVAIVGTRHPLPAAAAFTHRLAGMMARRGVVVVSGGAIGIDAMAHEGALAAGGRTWVVAGTGHGVLYPKEHGPLFERVLAGGGAMVWPFPEGTRALPCRFLQRNGVLVALADVVVVVQARIPSGALNAAKWARELGRPRWVVCPAPWDDEGFEGCQVERNQGARALTSVDYFLNALGMPETVPERVRQSVPLLPRNPAETRVLMALGAAPRHVDEVVDRCGLSYPEVMTALLTLALDDVLVEGPEGSFRLLRPP